MQVRFLLNKLVFKLDAYPNNKDISERVSLKLARRYNL